MPWYKGCTLMELLENTPIDHKLNTKAIRFPVQYVIRPISDKFHDFRGYAGRLSGGILKKGDTVTVLPSGLRSTVAAINLCENELYDSFTPHSITVQLTDDIDVSRGDMLAGDSDQPVVSQDITMMICWFNEKPLQVQQIYHHAHHKGNHWNCQKYQYIGEHQHPRSGKGR